MIRKNRKENNILSYVARPRGIDWFDFEKNKKTPQIKFKLKSTMQVRFEDS
jgi:hypothetical protein